MGVTKKEGEISAREHKTDPTYRKALTKKAQRKMSEGSPQAKTAHLPELGARYGGSANRNAKESPG